MKKHRSRNAKLVEDLLQKYPRTRNSDNDLIIGMLHLNGVFLSESDREIIRGMSFEGITRERRKLQEQGLYLPSDPEVARKRRIKGYEIQQVAPGTDAQDLHDRISNNDY